MLSKLWRKKQVFLQLFNIPKCMVVGLSMVEGLFSLLFYCESGINQYARQKTLTDAFGASLSLLEISCPSNFRQKASVTLNRFCLLSKKNPTPCS